jgi:uncharacterized membrane protein
MSANLPPNSSDSERARQRTILIIVIVALLVMAGLVLTVVPKLILPARIFISAMDLVLAAVLALVLRHKFSRKG